MIHASFPQANGAITHGEQDGLHQQDRLHQTVQQFFQQVNWEDHPPEIQVLRRPTVEGNTQLLNLLLTVNQFFSAIPWDGDSGIASASPIAQSLPTAEEDNSFTLEDFTGLF